MRELFTFSTKKKKNKNKNKTKKNQKQKKIKLLDLHAILAGCDVYQSQSDC